MTMKRYESRQNSMFIDGQPEMHEAADGEYIHINDPALIAAREAMSFGGEGPWSNILLHNAGGVLIEYGNKENMPHIVEMGKALKLKGEKEHNALAHFVKATTSS